MKKIQKLFLILASTLSVVLAGCGEQFDLLKNVKPAEGARIKFIHAAPDAPGVAIYVNDQKFSGLLTVAPAIPGVITYGNAYPALDYATIAAGTAKTRVIAPATATTAEIPIFAGDVPVEANKYYTVFATGLAQKYTPLVLEDKIPAPSNSQVFYRVVNLVPNSKGVTVAYGTTTFASNLAYGKATDFTPIGVPTGYVGGAIAYSGFTIKTDGAAGIVSNLTNNYSGVTAGRVYTIVIRGVLPATPTVASTYPITVSTYTNY